MADFTVRSDSVDVEQIMRQIRARIREKRGADYTEAELQQLASVKLEKFLDPRGVRSDLVEAFRKHRIVSPEPPKYTFEDTTMYETHRGALRAIRRLLHPILKLFINPNPLIHAMHVQARVNEEFHRRFRQREEMDPLYYELVHNLVLEVTRLGIEVQNMKMRVESLSSRMDFDERRGRALESVVQYRTGSVGSTASPGSVSSQGSAGSAASQGSAPSQGSVGSQVSSGSGATQTGGPRPDGEGRRRRRRRRRRRPGHTMGDQPHAPGSGPSPMRSEGNGPQGQPASPSDEFDDADGDGGDDGGFDGGDDGPDDGAPNQ